jgi:hypothetical protein
MFHKATIIKEMPSMMIPSGVGLKRFITPTANNGQAAKKQAANRRLLQLLPDNVVVGGFLQGC